MIGALKLKLVRRYTEDHIYWITLWGNKQPTLAGPRPARVRPSPAENKACGRGSPKPPARCLSVVDVQREAGQLLRAKAFAAKQQQKATDDSSIVGVTANKCARVLSQEQVTPQETAKEGLVGCKLQGTPH